MNSMLKMALVGLVVVMEAGCGSGAVSPSPVVSASPGASPSASAAPSVTASPSPSVPPLTDTSTWVAFASARYGYKIAHPAAWTATPATRDWSLKVNKASCCGDPTADNFIDGGATYQIGVDGFAAGVAPGMTEDDWIAAAGYGACAGATSHTVMVDGHAGRIIDEPGCADSMAFVFIDGRVYVFAVWREGQDPLLEAFLSTVKLQQ